MTLEIIIKNIRELIPGKRQDLPSSLNLEPYRKPEKKEWNETQNIIEVDYNPVLLIRPLRFENFFKAFQVFYDDRTKSANLYTEKVPQSSEHQWFVSQKFYFGLDTHKSYFYFVYGKEDTGTEDIIKDFVHLLTDKHF